MFINLVFILAAIAVLAASVLGDNLKVKTSTKTVSQASDNMKGTEEWARTYGPSNIMVLMEREIAKFQEEMQSQREIMQEAKHEIDQLKDTVQRQAKDMIAMTQKLDTQEGIINKQGLKLRSNEKDIKELKLCTQKQDKEMTILKKQNLILKTAIIKQSQNAREDSTEKKENIYLQRDDTAKDTVEESDIPNHEDNTQDLSKNNKLRIKTVTNRIPYRNRRAGFQGWANDTGIAFSAYLSQPVYNMGTGHTIKCDKALINDGNAYSPYTGTFTVPETGVYFLTFHIDAYHQNDDTVVKLVVNNRNIVDADAQVKGTSHHVSAGNSAIIRLNSGEKVWLEIYSTPNVELFSFDNYRFVTFSGYMLY